jgi:DNA (cytosine-5)-methyltransferase 1
MFNLDDLVAEAKQVPVQRQAALPSLDELLAQTRRQRLSTTAQQLERLALVRAQHFAPERLRGLDLFAGAGGFTIGALQQNCPVIGVEYAQTAVQTGKRAGHDVLHMDVRQTAHRAPSGLPMDVLIGGPPCQPFSSAGRKQGRYDPREGFGMALQAIDAWRPRRVALENVANLLSVAHRGYLDLIMGALAERYKHAGVWLLNARAYGVPQSRERAFIWAAEVPLDPPAPTHGPGTGQPYVTVAQTLPQLMHEGFVGLMTFQGGAIARTLQEPARTISGRRNFYWTRKLGLTYRGAGSVPSSKARILTPEETQVLQAFPATFGFVGNMAERAMQIGNAVPPPLAAAVVGAVTAGLRPRKAKPTELLDTFKRLNESIWVVEPRPWADRALIGVTTMKAEALGALVPVYDAFKLQGAVLEANLQWAAQQQGTSIRGLSQQARQAAQTQAISYLGVDKQSSYNPAAPVVVPARTLAALGLPVATMLLTKPEREQALMSAALRIARQGGGGWAPDPQADEDSAHDVLQQTLSQYAEWGWV